MKRPLFWLCLANLVLTSHSSACWNMIEPRGFASRCPVIVTGTITKIDAGSPHATPSYDIAHIRIAALHKNRLTDSPFRVGDVIKARMSAREAKVKVSTDLRYPLKDTALWLIHLDVDGVFSLTSHPVQRQPVGTERKVIAEALTVSKTGEPVGTHTKAEWIARMKASKGDPKDGPRKAAP